ncbi:serine/threonine-protein kinase [Nocardioides solisilvae]|uniref:serine/threonine-protein kinase n=1 Tax=Nocardioides solisilvae TaxID=1542435 RepID=UPI000D74D4FB|nr:serine/threonine-protein kinase [Nocardioides solisilvae]
MSSPRSIGRYPVRRRLGAGAFATVWLAEDEELDSPVAIKVLADNWSGDEHVRRRFVEEGRFLRKVESPHVVPVYDAGETDDGRPYLVMAYADRGTLAERVAALPGRPLPRDEALRILVEVGAGLQALHARGVLHRDVKPGNVLLRADETGESGGGRTRAMLADLGLGKALDVSSRLTVIAGTPSYVAPEQARGEGLDGRADLFSLAALAHRLLVGRPAWSHDSLAAAAEPPPLAPLDGLDPALAAVVARGLAADREQRQAGVAEFVADLVRATGGGVDVDRTALEPLRTALEPLGAALEPDAATVHEPSTLPGPAPAASRRPALLLAGGALVLAAGGGLGWAAAGSLGGEQRVEDASGTLAVTVPAAWAGEVRDAGWTPPGRDASLPALSVGSAGDWRNAGTGAFVALLDGDDLPGALPGHPECGSSRVEPGAAGADGEAMTAVHRDCPAPASVVLEHLEQVGDDRQLWVQVRGADLATVRRVLDSVEGP